MRLLLIPVAIQMVCPVAAKAVLSAQAGFESLQAFGFGTLPGVPVG